MRITTSTAMMEMAMTMTPIAVKTMMMVVVKKKILIVMRRRRKGKEKNGAF